MVSTPRRTFRDRPIPSSQFASGSFRGGRTSPRRPHDTRTKRPRGAHGYSNVLAQRGARARARRRSPATAVRAARARSRQSTARSHSRTDDPEMRWRHRRLGSGTRIPPVPISQMRRTRSPLGRCPGRNDIRNRLRSLQCLHQGWRHDCGTRALPRSERRATRCQKSPTARERHDNGWPAPRAYGH